MKKISKESFLRISVVFLLILSIGLALKLNKYIGVSDISGKYEPIPEEDYKKRIVESQNEYVVFENNVFSRYVDSKLVESGTYEQIYDHVYMIKSQNFNQHIYYTNDSFYLYYKESKDTGDEYILKYVKMKK
ncbi:MAG: hypothetical protein KZY61_05565 [Clostridiaceae bacterium]|nr:hypothetical protein [Clostridiaceae bacterium]MBW4858658.1 hypothetical protein [Clostridiaceae bacterium]MBW4868117.1 hypothetical protein [Clostridiaceae bacterium]